MTRRAAIRGAAGWGALAAGGLGACQSSAIGELAMAGFDATQHVYADLNHAFAQAQGRGMRVSSTHAGSGAQTQSLLDGLTADVAGLATAYDMDVLARAGLCAADWRDRLPHGAAPFTSTIVFVVRAGNPKAVTDWGDLVKPDLRVVLPSPKTSGGGRWAHLAAHAAVMRATGGDAAAVIAYLRRLYAAAPTLAASARAASAAFLDRGVGDVLITWEVEARRALGALDADAATQAQILAPRFSIRAETPLAVMQSVVDARGNRALAEAYVRFHFEPAAQEIAALRWLRPADPAVAARFAQRFPPIPMTTVEETFGGWDAAHAAHFAPGALFDQLTVGRR